MISSTRLISITFGINPAPIPWILCGPGCSPDNTADVAGSTAIIFTSGFFSRSPSPVPVSVPPVPTDDTKISTFPSVSCQISCAVVTLWIAGLASFSNCCGMNAFPYSSFSCAAFSIAPRIPARPGVSTISAPSAFTILRRSILMVSGIVRIRCNPFDAVTNASPIPVLPLVGSMMTVFWLILPSLIPCSIIAFATRSFTLPSGLKYSSFATTCALSSFFFS